MTEAREPLARRIYHITTAADWAAAQAAGEYRLSTRGATLEEVGFIHASFRQQVAKTAAFVFGDFAGELVLLVIDTSALPDVRVESGGDDLFPHIYGPLPLPAVAGVLAVERDESGTIVIPVLSETDEGPF